MSTVAFIYTVLHVFSVSDYIASQIAMGIGEIRGMLRGRYCWLEAGGWLVAGWLANRLKFFILVRDRVSNALIYTIQVAARARRAPLNLSPIDPPITV